MPYQLPDNFTNEQLSAAINAERAVNTLLAKVYTANTRFQSAERTRERRLREYIAASLNTFTVYYPGHKFTFYDTIERGIGVEITPPLTKQALLGDQTARSVHDAVRQHVPDNWELAAVSEPFGSGLSGRGFAGVRRISSSLDGIKHLLAELYPDSRFGKTEPELEKV